MKELLGNVLKGAENKQFTEAVFPDLSKVFDSLEHYVLLQKLELYGVRGHAKNWFESYLLSRKMRVRCCTCTKTDVIRELPRVSVIFSRAVITALLFKWG